MRVCRWITSVVRTRWVRHILGAMNHDHVRRKLEEKQRELLEFISQLDENARAVGGEIGDEIDAVTNAETKAAAFEAAGIERRMLVEVQDALHRLDDGTYGTCVDCGRQIEENRLDATPWTPYCRADQEKHDSTDAAANDLAIDSR